ncbi:hypothetical protein QBC36DRAFT_23846 [Triangularia setosa]|uniref:Uncharacterized protein n=1 Tax=Triangularia setosa TaxID=2587417 RepID=A0AAN7A4W5_9PEZI|nr:hypothetical protein QBC36DRAFT_23846 [Podospora setosa]
MERLGHMSRVPGLAAIQSRSSGTLHRSTGTPQAIKRSQKPGRINESRRWSKRGHAIIASCCQHAPRCDHMSFRYPHYCTTMQLQDSQPLFSFVVLALPGHRPRPTAFRLWGLLRKRLRQKQLRPNPAEGYLQETIACSWRRLVEALAPRSGFRFPYLWFQVEMAGLYTGAVIWFEISRPKRFRPTWQRALATMEKATPATKEDRDLGWVYTPQLSEC